MPLPVNPAYDELHDALVPAQWAGPEKEHADRSLQTFLHKHGAVAYQAAIQRGQYSKPNGLFFGGTQPVWSNVTFHRILAAHVPLSTKKLVVLDYHSGLGPQGYGEPILVPIDNTSDDTINEAKRFFGAELTVSGENRSVSAKVMGSVSFALSALPNSPRCFYITLEFGTVPLLAVLDALRAEQCFINYGERNDAVTAAQIMRQMRDAFFVDKPAWKAAVFGRSADLAMRAFRAVA